MEKFVQYCYWRDPYFSSSKERCLTAICISADTIVEPMYWCIPTVFLQFCSDPTWLDESYSASVLSLD